MLRSQLTENLAKRARTHICAQSLSFRLRAFISPPQASFAVATG